MYMKNNSLKSISLINKQILFIDGLSRSGKSLLGPIIGSLKKTYPMQHQNLIDNLLQLLQLNLVNIKVCKSLINIFLNESIYYLNLSRCVNFRPRDNSSVLKDKNYKLFIKNLSRKEGDHVINQIKDEKKLPIYMSHDLLSVIDLLDKIIPNFKIIYVLRNPIDNIYSFHSKYNKRYKGKKYDLNNPRFFSLAFEKKRRLIPYYATKNSKLFLKLNNLEKSTYYYLKIIEKSQRKFANFKNKNKIKVVRFDDLVQDPKRIIYQFEKFLNTKTSSFTKIACKIEKIPRLINYKKRKEKFIFLKKNINKKLFKKLEEKLFLYEKNKLFL
tara:strand:+ start:346 stop:1326 length:981 start_codon:yes stop_codon:yes gene_type:complete